MAKAEKEIYRNELAKRQQVIKDANLPVIVILEGWGPQEKEVHLEALSNTWIQDFSKFITWM